jgi:hypothetical protein
MKQLSFPQYPAVYNNTVKGFIYYVNNWLGVESMNLLLLSYTSRLENRNDTTTNLTTKLSRA